MGRRMYAAGIHFIFSGSIALVSGIVVFCVWYPSPYAFIAGGWALFAMIVGIDVILGPCLTALVASPDKPFTQLRTDIFLIALVQLLAFLYGMGTIAMTRPVHMVFEVDRFRVVSAADITPEQLAKAPDQYRHLPWTGPTLIAARKSVTQEEMMYSLDLGLQGVDLSMQPDRWIDYAQNASVILQATHPVKPLLEKYPEMADKVRTIAANNHLLIQNLRFLPLMSRQASWVALVAAPDARIVGYLPVDGFF